MTTLVDSLPDDPATLKAMVLAERARADRLTQILKEMQRHRFGRRAETLPLDQLELGLEDVQQDEAAEAAREEKADPAKRAATTTKRRTNRGALPAHLPRIETIIDVEDKACPCCSGALHLIGEDRAERLDIIPAQLRVLVVRRPKYACRACEDVVIQAPAPARLIEGGIPTEATVVRYALSRWAGLSLFLDDGHIELDNNTVERAIRPLALNRKNALFAGSDGGAEHWAVLASLIETAKLNDLDPEAYLADIITRIVGGHPQSQIEALMPWAYVRPASGVA